MYSDRANDANFPSFLCPLSIFARGPTFSKVAKKVVLDPSNGIDSDGQRRIKKDVTNLLTGNVPITPNIGMKAKAGFLAAQAAEKFNQAGKRYRDAPRLKPKL